MHEVVSMSFSSVLSARQLNREKKEGGTKRRERERERERERQTERRARHCVIVSFCPQPIHGS